MRRVLRLSTVNAAVMQVSMTEDLSQAKTSLTDGFSEVMASFWHAFGFYVTTASWQYHQRTSGGTDIIYRSCRAREVHGHHASAQGREWQVQCTRSLNHWPPHSSRYTHANQNGSNAASDSANGDRSSGLLRGTACIRKCDGVFIGWPVPATSVWCWRCLRRDVFAQSVCCNQSASLFKHVTFSWYRVSVCNILA